MAIPKDVEALIHELASGPKYVGECPNCGESFKLRDAGLFYFDNFTPEGREAKKTIEDGVEELEHDRKEMMDRIKKGAPKTSLAVNVGKVCEKVAPALKGFPYPINDCRFLAEPIDYLIFKGIGAKGRVDELIFMDIKTGQARLKKEQRFIKDAVDRGKVELRFY